jgi:hypothetical protein
MLGITPPEFPMTNPNNERAELHDSTLQLRAAELDAVSGGSARWFEVLSNLLKAQTETQKAIAQNIR